MTAGETISIKDSEVYPTHLSTLVSLPLHELRAIFATKPVNSWPLSVYLSNFCLILKESLFKGHKPSTQQRRLWPKPTCRHTAERSFKPLTHDEDVKTLTYPYARTHTPCPPSISISAMPQVPSYTTGIVFLMQELREKFVTVSPLALFRPNSIHPFGLTHIYNQVIQSTLLYCWQTCCFTS